MDATTLFKVISNNAGEIANLQRFGIGKENLQGVINAIKRGTTPPILDLSHNHLSDDELNRLSGALYESRSVEQIILTDNPFSSDAEADFREKIPNITIKTEGKPGEQWQVGPLTLDKVGPEAFVNMIEQKEFDHGELGSFFAKQAEELDQRAKNVDLLYGSTSDQIRGAVERKDGLGVVRGLEAHAAGQSKVSLPPSPAILAQLNKWDLVYLFTAKAFEQKDLDRLDKKEKLLSNERSVLGLAYLFGISRDVDLLKGWALLRKAAEGKKGGRARCVLGECFYLQGNFEDARKEWEIAYKEGLGIASYQLAKLYIDGKGVARDRIKALGYLNAEVHTPYPATEFLKSSLEADMQVASAGFVNFGQKKEASFKEIALGVRSDSFKPVTTQLKVKRRSNLGENFFKGIALNAELKREEALDAFKAGHEKGESLSGLYYGQLLFEEGRPDAALEVLQRLSLEEAPVKRAVNLLLASIYKSIGRKSDAERKLQAAYFDESPEAGALLASMKLFSGESEVVSRFLEGAVKYASHYAEDAQYLRGLETD